MKKDEDHVVTSEPKKKSLFSFRKDPTEKPTFSFSVEKDLLLSETDGKQEEDLLVLTPSQQVFTTEQKALSSEELEFLSFESQEEMPTAFRAPSHPTIPLNLFYESKYSASEEENVRETYSENIEIVGENQILEYTEIASGETFSRSSLPSFEWDAWKNNFGQTITTDFKAYLKGSSVSCGEDTYLLSEMLHSRSDFVWWKASKKGGQNIWIQEMSHSFFFDGLLFWSKISNDLPWIPPFWAEKTSEKVRLFFLIPSTIPWIQWIENLSKNMDLHQLMQNITQLGLFLEKCHALNIPFQNWDHRAIFLSEKGELSWAFFLPKNTSQNMEERPFFEGFSDPRSITQPCDPLEVDRYSFAMLSYYLFARRRPFELMENPFFRLPELRLFQRELPMGIESLFVQALSTSPQERFPTLSSFVQELQHRIEKDQKRQLPNSPKFHLDIGYELHEGLEKRKRNPINQDALFWRYDAQQQKGLFVIADGVSICSIGTGEQASSMVVKMARKIWEALLSKPIFQQKTTSKQRQKILQSIADASNQMLAKEINQQIELAENPTDDFMGTTFVAAFIDEEQVTIASLGDSRCYLLSEGWLEALTVDHNLKNREIQELHPVVESSSKKNSSYLTQCIGQFYRENGEIHPSPLYPEFLHFHLLPHEKLLLCSDGIIDYVGKEENERRMILKSVLQEYPNPMDACFWLMVKANQMGGGDNISLILLATQKDN